MSKKKLQTHLSAKELKVVGNLMRTTKQYITGKGYIAQTFEELVERLAIVPQYVPFFKTILDDLRKEKVLDLVKGRYVRESALADAKTGTIHMHARGFGFVTLEGASAGGEDVFIPKHLTMNAIDGDTVEVQVSPEVSEKGPEGKVLSILERGRSHLAGVVRVVEKKGIALAYVPLLGEQQRVVIKRQDKIDLKVGDRVTLIVEEWGGKNEDTICRLKGLIGHISDPSVDVKAATEEFELRSVFSNQVVEEARAFGSRVSLKEIAGREDLRDQEVFTIDPDTAKDFDDALSLRIDRKKHYHLGVHIADVSHYVTHNSALDKEAKQRCNSTYFPGTVIPMLPHELSSHLCSLKPKVNRLTVSVFVEFDPEGNMLGYRIAKSVIRSAKRFTYREAKEVLDGKKTSPHAKTLKNMVALCHLLKKKRYERGSIEFAMPELVILVDEKGNPTGTDYVEYDITHQLVEEFMLKANELVALHLANQGRNLTYRIHDVPSEENMKDFAFLVEAFGFRLSEKPKPEELQKLFAEVMQTEHGRYLATAYIRRMRLAIYSPENIGHYGLALTHYCHFTSPIRRYVDLVVHRILFGDADDRAHLEEIAQHCSEQERISAKAEGNVSLLKKLRLLESIRAKNPRHEFEALVTKVKPFGVTFEIADYMLEGFLHVSELSNDYYVFDEGQVRLIGRHTGEMFCMGSPLTLMLLEVDLVTLECRWALVGSSAPKARFQDRDQARRPKVKKKGKKGRSR